MTKQQPESDDEKPLYRFSWGRFVVVGTSLVSLPIWAPLVKKHLVLDQLLMVVPFVLIFVASIAYVAFAFPTKSIRRKRRQNKK